MWNLSTMDVSSLTGVTSFITTLSLVTTIDLSAASSLVTLYVWSLANLTTLNIKNGNNTNMSPYTTFANRHNTIKVKSCNSLSTINVDSVAYSTANWPTTGADDGLGTIGNGNVASPTFTSI